MARQQILVFHEVATAGMPPTDMESTFIGRNSNGHYGCFNHIAPTDYGPETCIHLTPEEGRIVMTGLVEWARVSP